MVENIGNALKIFVIIAQLFILYFIVQGFFSDVSFRAAWYECECAGAKKRKEKTHQAKLQKGSTMFEIVHVLVEI